MSTSHGTFKGKIKLKKYSREEYDSMSMAQQQQLYKFQLKGKKTQKNSKALEARVTMLKAKTDNSRDENLFADENPKANNRNNAVLDRKGCSTRQSHTDT